MQRFFILCSAVLCMHIAAFLQAHAAPMAMDTTITLYGEHFLSTSVVRINGGAVPTTYVNSTTLRATIPSGTPLGRYPITVFNPSQGGGVSGTQYLDIVSTSDTSLALQYNFETRQTTFRLIDSSRSTTVSAADSALWWSYVAPYSTQSKVDMKIAADGNYKTTILELTPQTTTVAQAVKLVMSSLDSTIIAYDNNGTVLSVMKQTNFGVYSFRGLVDSLRNQGSQAAKVLRGIIPGQTNTLSMQEFVTRESTTGSTVVNLGGGRFQLTRSTPSIDIGMQMPSGSSTVTIVNTNTDTIETMSLMQGSTVLSRTTFQYNGGAVSAMITETFDTAPGGTPMKTVNVIEYTQMQYSNYIR
jgi:hypothetical protein